MKIRPLVDLAHSLAQLVKVHNSIALHVKDNINYTNVSHDMSHTLENLRRYPGVNAAVDGVFSALEELSHYPNSYDAMDEVYHALQELCRVMLIWPYAWPASDFVNLKDGIKDHENT